ncbi:MAG: MerR family transcriptional regulator [Clostridia bacterium]|nr:MerR family transcriptional regulator [Clostridia bacterium]
MGLDVRKCRECGRLFQNNGRDLCMECADKLDKWFVEIRDYIDENPSARIYEIAEALEIPEKTILGFIKEGRIELREAVLRCTNCGKPIVRGTLCIDCHDKISGSIGDAVKKRDEAEEKAREAIKLHIKKTGGMHSKQ